MMLYDISISANPKVPLHPSSNPLPLTTTDLFLLSVSHSLDRADSWWLCKGLWILAHSQWKAVKRFFGRGLMAILQKLLYLTYIEDEKKEKGGEKPLYQTLLAHFSRATSLLLIVKEPNIIHISLTRCILQPPLYRLSQFSSVAQLCPTL